MSHFKHPSTLDDCFSYLLLVHPSKFNRGIIVQLGMIEDSLWVYGVNFWFCVLWFLKVEHSSGVRRQNLESHGFQSVLEVREMFLEISGDFKVRTSIVLEILDAKSIKIGPVGEISRIFP